MERGKAKTFRDLVVWQKSHSLVLLINSFSSVFPKHEIFGLTSQLYSNVIGLQFQNVPPHCILKRFKIRRWFGLGQNVSIYSIEKRLNFTNQLAWRTYERHIN
ncbi:MAG: hypothetical protein DRP78_06125 [Candidatus Omnitrophota bacterium]|nr:MAG: hypothetical protein DRP78_06125 [Candidatus Omnitrophota bacterium]